LKKKSKKILEFQNTEKMSYSHPADKVLGVLSGSEKFEQDVDNGLWYDYLCKYPEWADWIFGYIMSRGNVLTVKEIKFFISKGVDIDAVSEYIDDIEEPPITPLGYTKKRKWKKMEMMLIEAGATK
jgi:hypothetical protein